MWLYLPLWEPDPLGGHLGTGVHRKRTCDRKSHGKGRSFDTVVAQSEWGDFICIPSHDIGFSIGSFSDTARLEEHFRKNLGQEDAITVAAALKSMERESE